MFCARLAAFTSGRVEMARKSFRRLHKIAKQLSLCTYMQASRLSLLLSSSSFLPSMPIFGIPITICHRPSKRATA
jgi:hypothetical protein